MKIAVVVVREAWTTQGGSNCGGMQTRPITSNELTDNTVRATTDPIEWPKYKHDTAMGIIPDNTSSYMSVSAVGNVRTTSRDGYHRLNSPLECGTK